MRGLAIAAVLVVARPVAAQPVRPMKAEAKKRFDAGLEAYADKDYQRAADELAAGHAVDPHADFLFPWAQAERLSGDCAAAVPLYRQVLAGVEADERRDVEKLIETCEAEAPSEPPPEETAAAPAEPAPPPRRDFVAVNASEIEEAPSPAATRPWYRDGWGAALTAGGAVGLAVGAGFLWSASRAEEDSGSAGDLDTFIDDTDRANRHYTIGAVSIGVGAALLTGGIIRYALSGTF